MKLVIAPNALKGSLTATAAARAMAEGARRALAGAGDVGIVAVPVSDGGDGLVEVLDQALGGVRRKALVAGPLGRRVEAEWLFVPEHALAVVETAAASGLALLPPRERAPLMASTLGTGELILAALRAEPERILVGLGGSATSDGGTGAARALGVRFLDSGGAEVAPSGGSLHRICRIDMAGRDPALAAGGVRVEALCDVGNPLLGETGAARVYAPQKGASRGDVEALESGMADLADVIERDLGMDVRELPGAGAAGGLGAGLVAFAGATLRRGVDVVFELVGLEAEVSAADLVLTAEGALDCQTAFGKAPAEVARLARRFGVPCIALAGSVPADAEALRALGIVRARAFREEGMSLEDSMRDAARLLSAATESAVREFLSGGKGVTRVAGGAR